MSLQSLEDGWSLYNTSATQEKRDKFRINQNLDRYPKEKEIDSILNRILADHSNTFKGKNINSSKVKTLMRATSNHESLGGKYKRQVIKNRMGKSIPKGTARGWWQVEPVTARSILFEEAKDTKYLGNRVKSRIKRITGKTIDELEKMKKNSFNKLLTDNQEFNGIVATLTMLVKLDKGKRKSIIAEDISKEIQVPKSKLI